jgi:hypothetical protein
VWKVDPDQPISDLRPLSAIVEGETTGRSVQVRAGRIRGSLVSARRRRPARLLACRLRRTREFGVRLALARATQIVSLVARRG